MNDREIVERCASLESQLSEVREELERERSEANAQRLAGKTHFGRLTAAQAEAAAIREELEKTRKLVGSRTENGEDLAAALRRENEELQQKWTVVCNDLDEARESALGLKVAKENSEAALSASQARVVELETELAKYTAHDQLTWRRRLEQAEAREEKLSLVANACAESIEGACKQRCTSFLPYGRHAPECFIGEAEDLRAALASTEPAETPERCGMCGGRTEIPTGNSRNDHETGYQEEMRPCPECAKPAETPEPLRSVCEVHNLRDMRGHCSCAKPAETEPAVCTECGGPHDVASGWFCPPRAPSGTERNQP